METVKYNKYAELDKYLVGGDTCLIYFHGGGLEAGNKGEFKRLAEYLNLEKIDCYLPEYRLYPHAKYPEFILDAADSVAYALKKRNIKK